MKIFLPKKLKSTGGTSTFARNFQAGMKTRGHHVTFSPQLDYAVLLASPRAPLPYLLHAKFTGRKIVQRLDGVYHPGTTAGRLWPLHNLPLLLIRNYLADSVVYQSRFSQQSCQRWLGGNIAKPSCIIYNGVDTTLFSPEGERQPLRDNLQQHVFITASRFRRSDQIKPILSAFTRYRQQHHANSKLVVIGNFEKNLASIPKKYQSPVITFLGTIAHANLPSYLRAADVFIFTHREPPCPNNVIEAMACGLPICGIADGAMPELVHMAREGYLLAVSGAGFFATRHIDAQQLSEQMTAVMKQRKSLGLAAREQAAAQFNIYLMIERYCQVFESLLS
jgi:glycosyltransferase involved in cell wall biosynthesis